jgi:hypothetical protein
MGLYINVPQGKEAWLNQHGENTGSSVPSITPTHLPVCLVDNGMFTAAAICYSPRELEAFNQPGDFRPKTWYRVPVDSLIGLGFRPTDLGLVH